MQIILRDLKKYVHAQILETYDKKVPFKWQSTW
jgi:hypothetical protein